MITIQDTTIVDCVVLKPSLHRDDRGVFSEIYKATSLSVLRPMQSNYSISKTGVLRGIHRTPYSKLVTCVSGKIYDVCVDLRPDSPTYKKSFEIELTSENLMSLYIPPYCGHGFLALEESVVFYHQSEEYSASVDETYCYKNFGIRWPREPLILSAKDSGICQKNR